MQGKSHHVKLAGLRRPTHSSLFHSTGVSLSLGLRENFFRERFTEEPFTPFRLFHYPAQKGCDPHDQPWGVGEHTDYGVLTILATDDDGLEVRLRDGKWVSAPYIPGTFIVNSKSLFGYQLGKLPDRLCGIRKCFLTFRVLDVCVQLGMHWIYGPMENTKLLLIVFETLLHVIAYRPHFSLIPTFVALSRHYLTWRLLAIALRLLKV